MIGVFKKGYYGEDMEDVYSVLLQSLLAFVVLFLIAKMLGKKQISQLQFTDYVIGISIGSIAAEMATVNDRPFYHFVAAMIVFGGLDFIISIISRKSHWLKVMFKGRPLILIDNGEIVYKNLVKSKLDANELMSLCRDKGFFNLQDICYCIFENSGKISVLPVSNARPTVAEDLDIPEEKVDLASTVVIDGKIIKKELKRLGKTEEWLLNELKLENNRDIKTVILANYHPVQKELTVFKK